MSDPIRSISQNNFILADQKEVSHDNTLSGNGTPESPLGLNETVLWSNAEGSSTIQLSESLGNFERIRFKIKTDQGFQYCEMSRTVDDLVLMYPHGYSNAWTTWLLLRYNSFTYTLTVTHSKSISHSFTANTTTLGSALDSFLNVIVEVVGINRIPNN